MAAFFICYSALRGARPCLAFFGETGRSKSLGWSGELKFRKDNLSS
jgi:hypothetical protein